MKRIVCFHSDADFRMTTHIVCIALRVHVLDPDLLLGRHPPFGLLPRGLARDADEGREGERGVRVGGWEGVVAVCATCEPTC